MDPIFWLVIGALFLACVMIGIVFYLPTRQRRRERVVALPKEPVPPGPGASGPTVTPPSDTAPALAEPAATTSGPGLTPETALEIPTAPRTRLAKLRSRLARSNSTLGKGLLHLLSRDELDAQTWEEIEDVLILADIGVEPAGEIMAGLKERVRVLGSRDLPTVRALLREELLEAVDPDMDRRLRSEPASEDPAVILVVGVNGAGKTTTVGKVARVLVAENRSVLLGAADTFRAAAAAQLTTWGDRVGVATVTKDEGSDPAAVAYAAVEQGKRDGVDVVVIDTAGRLQNKRGLMDELGKVKRIAAKPLSECQEIAEVLLVLDATTGQNGLQQAQVFASAVNITGIVLTKLDGTAKGGIVVAVQRQLGVPVKLIGLGEGADDLAPFDPEGFVDAILA